MAATGSTIVNGREANVRAVTLESPQVPDADAGDGAALLRTLVAASAQSGNASGLIVGELLGLAEGQPMVRWPGAAEPTAIRARTIVDLHGAHVGRPVVLMFENSDWSRPIVMGVLCEGVGWPLDQRPGQIDVVADGERLIVSAREQLVLRCGKASITLTKAGKVLIEGEYVSSRSNGVNRIKGGSVQLN